jgi:CDP-glucose 4,6-dehydratase
MFNEFYRGKRVLVTGHTGFKGGWLSLWLNRLGAKVWGLSLPAPSNPNFHDIISGHAFKGEIECDIRNLEALSKAVKKVMPDLIFHLAAQPLVRLSYAQPLETFQTNALGTANLLEAVRKAELPCPVVVVTSDKCYENREWEFAYRENDPLGGHDVYSMSKAATELVAQAWNRSFFQPNEKLGPVVTVRAGNVIGGGDYAADRILPDCIRALIAKKPILVRNPHAVRPWQHVLECLSGYLWLATKLDRNDKSSRFVGAFNFGPEPSSRQPVRNLVEEVLANWPGKWVDSSDPKSVHEATLLTLSIEKAGALLRWSPAWDFQEAVGRSVAWYHARHAAKNNDMLTFSDAQIDAYEESARHKKIPWALTLNFKCRSCGSGNGTLILDLGIQPLANNLLRPEDLSRPEPKFPLRLAVCRSCWLLQIVDLVPPVQLFSEYLYFSSFSDLMLRHARQAAERYIKDFSLGQKSFVVEVASNDGYFLQYFKGAGVPCLGIEPAANIAKVAQEKGIETLVNFFGGEVAKNVASAGRPADLILGNNVFAHAPDINDFAAGLRALLKPKGRIILEFPYAVDFIEKTEFDTIYHEHVFYFNLTTLKPLFERHGLNIFHVERLPIHGGSLRLFACHTGARPVQSSVADLLAEERRKGVPSLAWYEGFANQVLEIKNSLRELLHNLKQQKKSVAAYGASAKGSTLLNFFGLGREQLDFAADRSTYKQGRLTPGTHIPIVPPEQLLKKLPDYTLLLTWNFADEILEQQKAYRAKGGKFIIPIPKVTVV